MLHYQVEFGWRLVLFGPELFSRENNTAKISTYHAICFIFTFYVVTDYFCNCTFSFQNEKMGFVAFKKSYSPLFLKFPITVLGGTASIQMFSQWTKISQFFCVNRSLILKLVLVSNHFFQRKRL
jgi:hypothetical protein